MRITFVDCLTRRQVSEGTAFNALVKFWDDSTEVWTASTPTTVRYRVDTPGGRQIVDWATGTPGTSLTITLSTTANAIQNDCNEVEGRVLLVECDTGLTTQYRDRYSYTVSNLVGVA